MPDDTARDLRASLADLSEALTGDQSLADTLVRVATLAVAAVPGADGAGLTLIEAYGPDTLVASADFVDAVDAVQYSTGEGPCILAVTSRSTQRSGSLGGESRWPRFGPQAGRLGVHSALSVPMLLSGRVVGSLNIYAHRHHAFDERAAAAGEEFSRSAAVTSAHALLLEESRRKAAQLEQALTTRATIDQAIGIIVARTGKTPGEAFAVLRRQSQRDHVKLNEVAAQLVTQARARALTRSRTRLAGSDEPSD